jgi:hypothetical protein
MGFQPMRKHGQDGRATPDDIENRTTPEDRNELKLLAAMGGKAARKAIGEDLEDRPRKWLRKAAVAMVDSVCEDWRQWRKKELPRKNLLSGACQIGRVMLEYKWLAGPQEGPIHRVQPLARYQNMGSRLPRSAYRLSLR